MTGDAATVRTVEVFLAGFVWWVASVWVTATVTGSTLTAVRTVPLPAAAVAAIRLPATLTAPGDAFPAGVTVRTPGWVWWPVHTVIAAGVPTAVAVAGRRRGWWQRDRLDRRRRAGVRAQAGFATRRDLTPLLVRDPAQVTDRFVLGRYRHRHWLATEHPARTGRTRGVRGAVMILGPTQSGKTHRVINAIGWWPGPVLACSVKTDLAAATTPGRTARGEVRIFDPAGITTGPTAGWDPLAVAGTVDAAQRTAELLVDPTGPGTGTQDRFWRAQATQLLAGLLWIAATARRTDPTIRIGTVARWVLALDRADTPGVDGLQHTLTTVDCNPDHVDDLRRVKQWLHGVWNADPRTSASVYLSARDAVWPWTAPHTATSADTHDLTLDWLTAGANTAHIVVPLGDEHRHGRLAAAVIGDVVHDAYTHANRTGPIHPPLLVVLDEAANTPLGPLPRWSATLTGAGIQLVTIWQTVAQLHALYGNDADTVLANHRTKIIHGASHDRATLDYISWLTGTEHLPGHLTGPFDPPGTGPTPGHGVPLLTPDMIRQLATGDILLIHGALPPVRLKPTRTHPK